MNIQYLPDDMYQHIKSNVYKKNLPKITNKSFTKDKKKILNKLIQICKYKAFDNESRQNKIKKLEKLFIQFLLYKYSGNIIQKNIYNDPIIFKKILKNLFDNFWTDEDTKDIFCIIILSSKMNDENKDFLCTQIEKSKSLKKNELQLNYYLNIIAQLNQEKKISRTTVNEIFYEIVEKNIYKVCDYLFKELS